MLRLLLVVVAMSAVAVPAALADSATIPNTGASPWSDPGHQSPLELVAGRVASTIAGRKVRVQCDDENAWQAFASEQSFDPGWVLGYVFWPGDTIYLAPSTCVSLEQFAAADSKPTKCSVASTQTQTIRTSVPVRVRVRYRVRVRVHGRTVWRWRDRIVTRLRTVTTTVQQPVFLPPAPCSVDGQPSTTLMTSGQWDAYDGYVTAMLILAHESIHLAGIEDDARANCYGMQAIAYIAEQFGDTPDDAHSLALYFYDQLYPGYLPDHPDYWSSDCYENGPLDRTPNDGSWP